MGAKIEILGINEEIYDQVNLGKLTDFYCKSFNDKSKAIIGLDTVFETSIKRYCFELAEMLEYYNWGFKWEGNKKIEIYDNNFIVTKEELLDLIEWYLSLCYVFSSTGEILFHHNSYIDEALDVKDNYNSKYEFFSFSYDTFIELKEKILSYKFQNYLWIYSF